jgi:hypothetical protein
MNNQINLTAQEMVEVAEVFQDSFRHILGNMPEEAQTSMKQLVAEFILKEHPWVLVTPEGLPRAIDLVWAREGVRDFLLSLSFTFFARWGHSDDQVEGLANNIARGVAMVQRGAQHDAVPAEPGKRLVHIDAAQKVLSANRWLMIALMLPLFITVADLGTRNKAG